MCQYNIHRHLCEYDSLIIVIPLFIGYLEGSEEIIKKKNKSVSWLLWYVLRKYVYKRATDGRSFHTSVKTFEIFMVNNKFNLILQILRRCWGESFLQKYFYLLPYLNSAAEILYVYSVQRGSKVNLRILQKVIATGNFSNIR